MVLCDASQVKGPKFPIYLPQNKLEELEATANALIICGKGILATDETPATLGVRFSSINLENTPENRRRYRELLYATDCSIKKYISGIIMHPESLNEQASDGKPMIELITNRHIIPGIKVNREFVVLPGTFDECTTEGLDELARRCEEYRRRGCRFAKWRCVFKISAPTPSHLALIEIANVLARYAAISQLAGLVPLIEPEVVTEGNHNIKTAQRVCQEVLSYVFKTLQDHHIFLEGLLIETNFVRAGHTSCCQSSVEDNAKTTLEVLQRTVPPAVPGILFLSGGLSEDDATLNLNAINTIESKRPWALTFSFGRAMHNAVLTAWKGVDDNIPNAQCVLMRLARQNSQASMGFYKVLGRAAPEKSSEKIAQSAY
ncbi:fructose 16 bisphosphate aldolase [Echinococcus multilocularis]|uniref:Fructose-bisphosphate aldolase n=1 Tax=Echinococcus multilocularis TaxID=6211 RepID=A0A068YIT8_ECHMU|nr:fructose 16 bisphosphate aldolase [Echinococcus multilocularis]